MLRTVKLLALVAMFLVALSSSAQVTTSALSGVVTDENQQAMIGATITALHTPSGTKYNAVTNMDGRYTIQGMRPGGPYTVSVSYIGYEPRSIEGVTLQLAETSNLDFDLSVDANALGEVVVTAAATKFRAEKTGAATNINSAQITNLPTVSRSLTDITRLSPYGGNGMSFAGTDGRTANFTVDGANFNNNFGLSDNLHRGYRGDAGCDLALRCSSDQLHRWWC